MSERDVQTVRELYEGLPVDLVEIFADESALKAWRGRIESYIHPDFEGGNPNPEAKVVGPVTRGVDAFTETWREFLEAWDSWWFDAEDFIAGSEGNVVVLLSIRARSKRDQVDIPIVGANVVIIKDDKVARIHLYFDRDAALKDAGIAR